MPSWPSIAAPSGIQEPKFKGQYKNQFANGYSQSRPKWTKSRKTFTLSWSLMTTADRDTLEAFFDANLGGTFDWTHPLTGALYTVRFSDDKIDEKYITKNLHWRVSVKLEEV